MIVPLMFMMIVCAATVVWIILGVIVLLVKCPLFGVAALLLGWIWRLHRLILEWEDERL